MASSALRLPHRVQFRGESLDSGNTGHALQVRCARFADPTQNRTKAGNKRGRSVKRGPRWVASAHGRLYVLRFKDDCDFNWFNGLEPRPDSATNSADFWPKETSRREAAAAGFAFMTTQLTSKAFERELTGQ